MATVLIVDDSATMRKIIARTLRQAGLAIDEILEAGDGVEGLNVLAGNRVNLVLSDINMPNMDGLEFVLAARSSGCTAPIIMITTEGGEDVLAQALLNGANGSIKKPFTPDVIGEKLAGLL